MKQDKRTKNLTLTAMLLSLIIVLSIFESMLPSFPFLPPGVKLGLSNTVIMYSLFFTTKKNALFLAVLKSLFSFMTIGFVAFALSLAGGIASIIIMILLTAVFKDKISLLILSIFGAIFHNIGQIITYMLLLGDTNILYYLSILIISGIIMGSITGTILKLILPAFNKIFRQN
ncbi:MAG: Gx transporter family protein [Firmicutes bacterium]|nr:Gx transporter family protein [Bacillota bacterium]